MYQYAKITKCGHCRTPVHRDDKTACGYCECIIHKSCSNCAAAGNLPGVRSPYRNERSDRYIVTPASEVLPNIPYSLPDYRPSSHYKPSAFPIFNYKYRAE